MVVLRLDILHLLAGNRLLLKIRACMMCIWNLCMEDGIPSVSQDLSFLVSLHSKFAFCAFVGKVDY